MDSFSGESDKAAETLSLFTIARPDKEAVRERVEQIYRETRVSVGAYLRYIGLAEPSCDEVLQEVYLRLYLELCKGKNIENWKAWLFRVAHNEGVTARRYDHRFDTEELDWAQLTHPDASPEHELLSKERKELVQRALVDLSPQQRHCLYLRAEGLRYREIAEALGISLSSVNEFLRRALTRLAEAVDD